MMMLRSETTLWTHAQLKEALSQVIVGHNYYLDQAAGGGLVEDKVVIFLGMKGRIVRLCGCEEAACEQPITEPAHQHIECNVRKFGKNDDPLEMAENEVATEVCFLFHDTTKAGKAVTHYAYDWSRIGDEVAPQTKTKKEKHMPKNAAAPAELKVPTNLAECLYELAKDKDKLERLEQIEADLTVGFAKGNPIAHCLNMYEAKTLLIPPGVKGPRAKKIWGNWLKERLKAEGISPATGFRKVDAGEALQQFNPDFLAALGTSGLALTIQPTKAKPLGIYTEVVTPKRKSLSDALNPTAKHTEAEWLHMASTTLPEEAAKHTEAIKKKREKEKADPKWLAEQQNKLVEFFVRRITKLMVDANGGRIPPQLEAQRIVNELTKRIVNDTTTIAIEQREKEAAEAEPEPETKKLSAAAVSRISEAARNTAKRHERTA